MVYSRKKGGNLLSMEENLARKEVEKNGYACFYSPAIIVRHHILPGRLTKKWFLDRAYWNGVSSALINILLYKGLFGYLLQNPDIHAKLGCFASML